MTATNHWQLTSWPASISVLTWSRSSSSDKPCPLSGSWALIIMPSTSDVTCSTPVHTRVNTPGSLWWFCLNLEHSSSCPVHQTLPAPHLYTPTSTHLVHSGGSVWVLSTHHHTQYIRRYLLHTCTHPRQHTRLNSGGISTVTHKSPITNWQCLLFVLSVGSLVLVLTISSLIILGPCLEYRFLAPSLSIGSVVLVLSVGSLFMVLAIGSFLFAITLGALNLSRVLVPRSLSFCSLVLVLSIGYLDLVFLVPWSLPWILAQWLWVWVLASWSWSSLGSLVLALSLGLNGRGFECWLVGRGLVLIPWSLPWVLVLVVSFGSLILSTGSLLLALRMSFWSNIW